ncbi:MAG: hypothetical protein WC637_07050 [Victivallales bacterium]|jgi:hypothetical protein
MNAIRDIVEVKSNHIDYDLPHGFSSGKVELIIMPYDKRKMFQSEKKQSKASIRGSLRKYSNPSLINIEKKAWSMAVRDKHANS